MSSDRVSITIVFRSKAIKRNVLPSVSCEIMELGYWNTRGLAAPIRYALHYAGATFNDRTFEKGFSGAEWLAVKEDLGLEFPNCPYMIDGDIRLTQTNTILRYVARKFNLFGSDLATQLDIEQTLDALTEIKDSVFDICYARKLDKSYTTENFERFKEFAPFFKKKLAGLLSRFETKLGKDDTPYICGGELSVADFVLYEAADVLSCMFGESFLTPRVSSHKETIAALPAVATYRASEGFLKQPINNWCAVWKGTMDGVIEC